MTELPDARPRRRHRRRRHRLLGRLPPGPHGLEGRRAARARPAHLGHDVARGRADGHVRLDVGDVDRDAQVHPRPLRAARGRDRPVDRVQAGRLHRGRRRRRPARGVPPGLGVQPLLRRRRARDLARRGQGAVPARAHRRHPRRLLRQGGRPRQPGRRHDGARQGRAPCRARRSSRASRSPASRPQRGAVTGVDDRHGDIEAEYVVNCAGMWARQLGAQVGRQHPAAGRRALLPDHRADRRARRRRGRCSRIRPRTATSARRSAA